ncbi:hypothetical protein OC861_005929 [Tilletia horrida]|nr:hypothetical protein OC861_005929 [Tilletia horrida]
MKAFFANKAQQQRTKAAAAAAAAKQGGLGVSAGVGIGSDISSLSIPPFPSPLPHRLLSVSHTPQGILLLPKTSASSSAAPSSAATAAADSKKDASTQLLTTSSPSRHRSSSGSAVLGAGAGALLPWDRYGHPKPVSALEAREILDSRDVQAAIDAEVNAFGVIGLLRLFNCSYLLLITGRVAEGNFLHPAYPVYRPNRVFALPLDPELALSALITEADRQRKEAALAALNAARVVPDHEKTIGEDEEDDDDEYEDDDVYTPSVMTPDGRFNLSRPIPASARRSASTTAKDQGENQPADEIPPLAREQLKGTSGEVSTQPADVELPSAPKEEGVKEDDEHEAASAAAAASNLTPPSDFAPRMSPFFSFTPSSDKSKASAAQPVLSADERHRLAVQAELEDKVVKETVRQYADRGEMYFAYDVDLTRSISKKSAQLAASTSSASGGAGEGLSASSSAATLSPSGVKSSREDLKPFVEPNQTLPLWRRADRKFWHNEHMAREFADAGLHGFVLVILQGYFHSTTLPVPQTETPSRTSVDTDPADVLNPSTSAMDSASEAASAPQADFEPPVLNAQLFLISRRAKGRVGLRYQRRGLNDQGDSANTVETEQVLLLTRRQTVYRPGKTFASPLIEHEHVGYRVATFTQCRGSIPLFWSQSPFSLRPPIVMERSERDNALACKRHFESLNERYGHVTCINLAEQHGREGTLTESFRLHVNALEGLLDAEQEEQTEGDDEAKENATGTDSIASAAKTKAAHDDAHAPPKLDNAAIRSAVDALLPKGEHLPVHYHAFDFHTVCRGMKFENVKFLIEAMHDRLGAMGWFERVVADDEDWADKDAILGTSAFGRKAGEGGALPMGVERTQDGIFRVNCIDCLDRTNVVQSALARHMLTSQLEHFGVIPKSFVDKVEDAGEAAASVALGGGSNQGEEQVEKRVKIAAGSAATAVGIGSLPDARQVEFEFAYNNLWANNGDMISQIYAGTRALKGDFTRTGKRNMMGAFNDATNSIFRLALGAVTDFWRQTVIDFNYGLIGLSALERYNEVLNAQDPAETYRLARVRSHAIEMCAEIVLKEGEERLGGWTLFSPVQPNRVQAVKFEEKVLLMTKKALYVCAYDFTAEKLQEFARIRLGDITGIKKGLYLIAPNEGYHPDDHWGFVVSYLPAGEEIRLNNASMRNIPPPSDSTTPAATAATNFLAFRAVRNEFTSIGPSISGPIGSADASSASVGNESSAGAAAESREQEEAGMNSKEIVAHIVELVVEQCKDAGAVGDEEEERAFVKEETIQSLAEAKAQAGMFAPLIEGFKRRLWL